MNNKEKLIESAAIQMSQRGYANVSLDALIELTSISKSNLYYYYASKEELGLDVLKYWIEVYALLDKITILNPKLPPRKQMSTYFDRMIAFQKANQFCGNPCWLLTSEINTESVKTDYASYSATHTSNLQQFIAGGQKAGAISKKLDVVGTSHLILFALLGAEMSVRAEKSAIPLIKAAKLISHLLF